MPTWPKELFVEWISHFLDLATNTIHFVIIRLPPNQYRWVIGLTDVLPSCVGGNSFLVVPRSRLGQVRWDCAGKRNPWIVSVSTCTVTLTLRTEEVRAKHLGSYFHLRISNLISLTQLNHFGVSYVLQEWVTVLGGHRLEVRKSFF